MDEVRISKVARYTSKFEPSTRFEPDEDTWSLYHCDELDDDILKDASGNGNDARIYGATRKPASELDSPGEYYQQLDGWVRQTARKMPERSSPALEFLTANASVEVPAVEFDFTKPFTVEAWATPNGNWTPNDSYFRSIAQFGDLELKILPLHNSWQFHTWDERGIAAAPWGEKTIHWDRRTHVVGQWDGKHLKLFVNGLPCPGEMIAHGSISDIQDFIRNQLATANGSIIRIGSRNQERGTFGGTIDRFRLSRGARYKEPFAPTDFKADDSTIVMFDFHEGQGDVLHDLSGNGYHGKIVGAKWVGGEERHLPAEAEKPNRD